MKTTACIHTSLGSYTWLILALTGDFPAATSTTLATPGFEGKMFGGRSWQRKLKGVGDASPLHCASYLHGHAHPTWHGLEFHYPLWIPLMFPLSLHHHLHIPQRARFCVWIWFVLLLAGYPWSAQLFYLSGVCEEPPVHARYWYVIRERSQGARRTQSNAGGSCHSGTPISLLAHYIL